MKVLMLSRYGRTGASSRLRMLQYRDALADAGLETEFSPFFDDEYLARLYGSQRTGHSIRKAYVDRMRRLAGVTSGVTVIWLEKEALPWFPWPFERAMMPKGIPVVTDFDDAIFHRYDLHGSAAVRRVLGHKIDHVMAASDLVTAGNAYLADRARAAGARRVEVVPTVVDTDTYVVRPAHRDVAVPRIGWIGTPSTWTEYMAPMMPLLKEIAARQGARISAVGAGAAAADHPVLDKAGWSEEAEVASILDMDIGLMPLTDTPWARGKCGYKLLQYMACGLPVVASPVGVNAEIVEDGVTGLLATTPAEWRDALTALLRDADLRRRMGDAGRRRVERQYSLRIWETQVADLMSGVMKSSVVEA